MEFIHESYVDQNYMCMRLVCIYIYIYLLRVDTFHKWTYWMRIESLGTKLIRHLKYMVASNKNLVLIVIPWFYFERKIGGILSLIRSLIVW